MSQAYNIVRATYIKDFILELTFNDGLASCVDFSPFLYGQVFEPLKDVNFFKKFFLEGWTVAWPNGADVAPETLYAIAVKQSGKSNNASP